MSLSTPTPSVPARQLLMNGTSTSSATGTAASMPASGGRCAGSRTASTMPATTSATRTSAIVTGPPGMCSIGELASMSTAIPTAGADQLHAAAPHRRSVSWPTSTAPRQTSAALTSNASIRAHYREHAVRREPPLYARRP